MTAKFKNVQIAPIVIIFEQYGNMPSSPFRQKDYEMKLMDFCTRLGAQPQPDWTSGKTGQRRMAQKDAISCKHFGEMDC